MNFKIGMLVWASYCDCRRQNGLYLCKIVVMNDYGANLELTPPIDDEGEIHTHTGHDWETLEYIYNIKMNEYIEIQKAIEHNKEFM